MALHRRTRALVAASTLALVLAACATEDTPGEGGTTPPLVTSPGTATPSATPEPTTSSEPATTPTGDPVVNGTTVLTAPLPGAEVSGPTVTVTGEGTAFEATLDWRVTAADGTEVARDFTMAGANGEIAPFEFTVDLQPGEYIVRVWETSAMDGEEEINPVEARFSVVD